MCPSDFVSRSHGICVTKRKFFRISGSGRRPFVIAAGRLRLRILNAAFGVSTCPSGGRVVTALRANELRMGMGGRPRGCFLRPGSRLVCAPSAKVMRRRGIGTISRSS